MTRKDYELIANAFRLANGSTKVTDYDAESALGLLAEILGDRLEQDNPRFDRERFLTACGVK
jgi:hypothetical protein